MLDGNYLIGFMINNDRANSIENTAKAFELVTESHNNGKDSKNHKYLVINKNQIGFTTDKKLASSPQAICYFVNTILNDVDAKQLDSIEKINKNIDEIYKIHEKSSNIKKISNFFASCFSSSGSEPKSKIFDVVKTKIDAEEKKIAKKKQEEADSQVRKKQEEADTLALWEKIANGKESIKNLSQADVNKFLEACKNISKQPFEGKTKAQINKNMKKVLERMNQCKINKELDHISTLKLFEANIHFNSNINLSSYSTWEQLHQLLSVLLPNEYEDASKLFASLDDKQIRSSFGDGLNYSFMQKDPYSDRELDKMINYCKVFSDLSKLPKFKTNVEKDWKKMLQFVPTGEISKFLEKAKAENIDEYHPWIQIASNTLEFRKQNQDLNHLEGQLQTAIDNNDWQQFNDLLRSINIQKSTVSELFQRLVTKNESNQEKLRFIFYGLSSAFSSFIPFDLTLDKQHPTPMLNPKGLQAMMTSIQESSTSKHGKIRQQLPFTYRGYEEANNFDALRQKINQENENVIIFQDSGQSHVTFVYHKKENDIDHFVIMDSTGLGGPSNQDTYAEKVRKEISKACSGQNCRFYISEVPRQSDHTNCGIFALNDYDQLTKQKEAKQFMEFVMKNAKQDTDPNRSGVFKLNTLPPYLMKPAQSITQLEKYGHTLTSEQQESWKSKSEKHKRMLPITKTKESGETFDEMRLANAYIRDKFVKVYDQFLKKMENHISS